MSCISRILEIKGNREILPVSDGKNVVIENGGSYRDHEFLVIFNALGFRCGYVAVSPLHAVFSKKLEDEDSELIDVHGGVTFLGQPDMVEDILGVKCEDKWIGFDCGHAGDKFDYETASRYFELHPDTNAYIRSMMKEIDALINDVDKNDLPDKERTYEFVVSECKRMIDQLVEMKAA